MDIFTDMPAIQVYTGTGGEETKYAKKFSDRGGVALEPQFVPNSINMDSFDKPLLKANEKKCYYICLKF